MSKKGAGSDSNVIPFRRGSAGQVDPKEQIYGESRKVPAAVINLEERRQEQLATERRFVTRTVLSQFIGIFIVLPKMGLQPVSLFDISEAGLAFDLPIEMGEFNIGEQVTLRIYLSHDTYFSFSVKIANVRDAEFEGVKRHGGIFNRNDDSYKTLFFFSKFLESVAIVARKDSGDRLLGKID